MKLKSKAGSLGQYLSQPGGIGTGPTRRLESKMGNSEDQHLPGDVAHSACSAIVKSQLTALEDHAYGGVAWDQSHGGETTVQLIGTTAVWTKCSTREGMWNSQSQYLTCSPF